LVVLGAAFGFQVTFAAVVFLVFDSARKSVCQRGSAPSPTGDVNSGGLAQGAQPIELQTHGRALKPAAHFCKTLHRLKLRDDGSMVRMLTGAS
jgi:hypothetical protein